jgi:mycothiol synthase
VSELRWISPHDDTTDATMEAEGFRRVRLLHQMRRSLPVEPDLRLTVRPIEVRPFRSDDPGDVESFLRVNNRAFEWHPDQGGWDEHRLRERLAESWFDPAGFLVHEGADGGIDGFCWTKVHPAGDLRVDDPAMGEIFVIAADPSTHGTGLGRALTVAGLDHLADRSLPVGMLYVEADNAPAVSLYSSLGFEVDHSDAAYRRDRPDGRAAHRLLP